MPAWIRDRAQHLQAKNPDMEESTAFAIATQQAHKLGKTPKNYGTAEGKAGALEKYTKPRAEYRKTAAAPTGLMGFRPGAWKAQAGFTPPGMQTAGQRLQKSMNTGAFNADKGLKPLTAKMAFDVSMYSGDMNPPSLKQNSGAPPFRIPPLKVTPPVGQGKEAAAATTPAGRLAAAKAVGAPRVTPPPGPSIAEIAKPKGFGLPLPGATKTALWARMIARAFPS